MACQIVSFINSNKGVEVLLIHCYGGESRSRAVGVFAVKLLDGYNRKYFASGVPDQLTYDTLLST